MSGKVKFHKDMDHQEYVKWRAQQRRLEIDRAFLVENFANRILENGSSELQKAIEEAMHCGSGMIRIHQDLKIEHIPQGQNRLLVFLNKIFG